MTSLINTNTDGGHAPAKRKNVDLCNQNFSSNPNTVTMWKTQEWTGRAAVIKIKSRTENIFKINIIKTEKLSIRVLPSNKTGPHSYHSLPELQVGALEALMQEVLLLRVLLVQLDHWQFTWDKHRHPESVAEICQCCHAWGWQRAYRSPPPGAAQRTLAALLEQRQRCRKMSKNIRKRRWNKLRMEL